MQLINKNDRVVIIQDGSELGTVHYKVRTANSTLQPREINIEAGNLITATFDGVLIKDAFTAAEGLITVNRCWTVTAQGKWQLLFNYQPSAGLRRWLLPSVMYNNNEMGTGPFPRDGVEKGWSFREDRIPVPSCSILYNESNWQAVFTRPSLKEGEISSVKTYAGEGGAAFEISVPYVEEPFTYTEKGIAFGGLTAKTAAFFSVRKIPLEYLRTFFIAFGRCVHPSEIFINLASLALKLFDCPAGETAKPDWSRIAALKFHHLKYLLIDKPGITAIKMGRGNGLFQSFYEFAAGSFLVRGMEAATIFARAGKEIGSQQYLNIADRIGGFFLAGALPNGLHRDCYSLKDGRWGGYIGVGTPESLQLGANARCNGEAMVNYLRLYKLLEGAGKTRTAFLDQAKRTAHFYIGHQLAGREAGSFGRWWNTDGRPLNTLGTNGAYIISLLVELEKITGKTGEIDGALKKAGAYYATLVDKNQFYADTLDADCVDKEAGCALLRSFLDLYERSHDEYYLRYAVLAAGFVLSWMFTYNIAFHPGSPAGKRHFKTLGMTAVSVAHHHLDFYGLFIAYDLLRLWQASGDDRWKKCALSMIGACSQLISDSCDLLGRGRDFIGWQPEQVNQTNWDYKLRLLGTKGRYHTCVAWTVVLTLGAMLDIRERFPDILSFSLGKYDDLLH